MSSTLSRIPSDAELFQWDREHYWHAFTQMAEYEPLVIERAESAFLYTSDGRKLLDGCSSLWCNVHGHAHPKIDAAIQEQLGKVAHVTSLGVSNPTAIQLARKLADVTPNRLECVFFSCDGSSAVEAGLKLAFQYWRQCDAPQPQRDLYLALGNSYHGDTLGSVSVGGVSRFHAMFAPLLFDVVHGPCPDTYRCPDGLSDAELAEHYLSEYRKLFEQFGDRLAAVVVEPLVQGAAGMVMHPPGFLKGMRELADQSGTLLIADEIAVGMGRTGTLWACEQEGVAPDILCTAKGLSGGYLPMAATVTTRKIWNAFLGEYSESRSFFHGHTYGGNPLGAAAALATLEVFEEEKTLDRVQELSDVFRELLRPLAEHQHVGDVRTSGLIAAVELVQDKQSKAGYPWSDRKGYELCDALMEKGVWLRPIGNVVIAMPPLCCDETHLEQLAEALRFGLQQVSW
ncbi:MAG: adenosylmethionine--8-amino-7-oxononanoate transaminase [Planctomycetota bacterium]